MPGDRLDIEVAFNNRGITTSTTTDARLTMPDGVAITEELPPLETYQAYKMYQTWEVPNSTGIGPLQIQWEADTGQLNAADANFQNNIGSIELFVGRLPTPVAPEPIGLTQETILINASASYDEDGGNVSCEFYVPFDDGTRTWDY